MVKIKGPLFSVDAAGKFADAVVFQHNIYGVFVRRKEVKRKTNSIEQIFQNAEYSNAIDDWRNATQEVKNIYRKARKILNLSALAGFVKEWFSYRYNANYNYARYGHTIYGQFHDTQLKENIF